MKWFEAERKLDDGLCVRRPHWEPKFCLKRVEDDLGNAFVRYGVLDDVNGFLPVMRYEYVPGPHERYAEDWELYPAQD